MKEQIMICPHCGNKTPQEIKYTVTVPDDFFDSSGTPVGKFDCYFTLIECKTCRNIALVATSELDEEPDDLKEATILYPSMKKILSDVPEVVRNNYNEAKRVEKISPVAFVVLIRKALEYVCNEQKAEGKSLKEKIDYLAEKKIIPDNLAKMANALRFLGNIGAHINDFKISSDEVSIIDDLFLALIEYVYIAPQKLGKLMEKLKITKI